MIIRLPSLALLPPSHLRIGNHISTLLGKHPPHSSVLGCVFGLDVIVVRDKVRYSDRVRIRGRVRIKVSFMVD